MKVIYLDSVNDAFARLYVLLKETVADAYLITGNMIENPFYSQERFDAYLESVSYFSDMIKEKGKSGITLSEQVKHILDENDSSPLTEKAEKFLENGRQAEKSIRQKYRTLENILSSKPYTPVYIVPGSRDTLLAESLKDRYFHDSSASIKDVVLSGFSECELIQDDLASRFADSIYTLKHNDIINRLNEIARESKPTILAISTLLTETGIAPLLSRPEEINSEQFPKLIAGSIADCSSNISLDNNRFFLDPLSFGEQVTDKKSVFEGGFFYEIRCEEGDVSEILMKKLAGDRVYDIAGYQNNSGKLSETIIDKKRHAASLEKDNFENKNGVYSFSREVRAFRDIRNFFRIHQTEETEKRVEDLLQAFESMKNSFENIAIDMVGSSNVGLSQKSSDIDMVLYVRGGLECSDDPFDCNLYRETEEALRENFIPSYGFEIIDYINLDLVEASIRARDLDCPVTQRFVIYRSMCRPVNYRVIAPVEDLLNRDVMFRKEMEEQMREYFSILFTTPDTGESFEKYQLRLKSMGINVPDPIARKIKMLLGKEGDS